MLNRGCNVDAPVRARYLTFGSPQLLEPEIEGVVAAMRSSWIGTGPRAKEFKQAFASYIGTPHAVADRGFNGAAASLRRNWEMLNSIWKPIGWHSKPGLILI